MSTNFREEILKAIRNNDTKIIQDLLGNGITKEYHFYIARDNIGALWLYIGKPFRGEFEFCDDPDTGVIVLPSNGFNCFGINKNDYADLKWEDEPIEVLTLKY